MPLSALYAAIRKGLIRINGKCTAINYRTVAGDALSIAESLLAPGQQTGHPPQATDKRGYTNTGRVHASGRSVQLPADIPILLKTTDLLIVNKPAGIPVHGNYSIDTLLSATWTLFSDTPHVSVPGRAAPQNLSFKPGPLHRLDKDTTGILCFSRTLAGAQWFSQCLREKTVDKYYLGIVRGAMNTQLIIAEDENGKTMTQCYSLNHSTGIDASLMLFRLITGKKHQIRKHTMGAGHPLVGDRKYRGGDPLPGYTRYQLHAWRLFFPVLRPVDIPAFIEAPLFSEMEACLNRYFSDWRKTVSAILTNQTQITGNS